MNSPDVLIVGSGPIGCTFARYLVEGGLKVLIVEAGSQLSAKYGENAKNVYLYNYNEDGLDTLSNVVKGELIPVSQTVQKSWPETLDPSSQPREYSEGSDRTTKQVRYKPLKRGFNGQNPEQKAPEGMPAAASSFQVGGMAGHWTCCTPRPVAGEIIPGIPELDQLYHEAERLVKTNQVSFEGSLRGQVVARTLAEAFPDLLEGRHVGMLPLACERKNPTWVQWTGADTILGKLAVPGANPEHFELRSETFCRSLIVEESEGRRRIKGAVVEDLKSSERYEITARYVIVAANSFYTPQLLHNSGIRPEPLGRYLNDQPMLFCQVVLNHHLLEEIRKLSGSKEPVPIPYNDPIPNVWIPYSEEHPFHCQIHRDSFPYSQLPGNTGIDHRTIIELRWFCCKDIQRDDRVTFSSEYKDFYDMPQPTIHYTYTKKDEDTISRAFKDITKAALSLGGFLPGREPALLPRGSSLHFQGSYRVGDSPQDSVCDKFSRVWHFENLFLGGNGLIPTATACNPTLTSIVLAIRASRKILEETKK